MKASLKKRMIAYLIDLIILLVILGLISLFYKPEISQLNNAMDLNTLKYASGDIGFNEYINKLSTIYKEIDIKNIIINIINVVYIISYFIIFPYFNNGQTVGKQIMDINVKSTNNGKLTLTKLFIRNLIINGLLYLVSVIICSLIIPKEYYFISITLLGIIQISLTLASIFMVIYRKDKKGLHDLLAHTWVASNK